MDGLVEKTTCGEVSRTLQKKTQSEEGRRIIFLSDLLKQSSPLCLDSIFNKQTADNIVWWPESMNGCLILSDT